MSRVKIGRPPAGRLPLLPVAREVEVSLSPSAVTTSVPRLRLAPVIASWVTLRPQTTSGTVNSSLSNRLVAYATQGNRVDAMNRGSCLHHPRFSLGSYLVPQQTALT
jgi:hypothetical protein